MKVIKRLISITVALLTFILFINVKSAFADTDDFYSGYWADSYNLDLQILNGAYQYFSGTIYSYSYKWNNISSKLRIRNVIYDENDSDVGAEITVDEDSVADYGDTTKAVTINYTSLLGGLVETPDWDSEWCRSVIILDYQRMKDLTSLKLAKTYIHELGHAIGLDHPLTVTAHLTPIKIPAVMHSSSTGLPCDYSSPQQHDKDNVKAKYDYLIITN